MTVDLLTHLPAEIKRLPYVPYRLVLRPSGRYGKVPIDPVSGRAVPHRDIRQHLTFSQARQFVVDRLADGLGVVLDDAHVAVDLDDCVMDGQLTAQAAEIVEIMDSYTEVSVSGHGLKILVQGTKPGPRSRGKGVEIYGEGSYIALTGDRLNDTALRANQPAVDALYAETFDQPVDMHSKRPAASTTLDVVTVIQRARRARNGQKFSELYDMGDTSLYTSVSEAEFALLRQLHFWTGPNAALLDEIFRQSALYDKKRWLRPAGGGHTYGSLTLSKVIECGGPVYRGR
ncbi:phage NrS-1 polymerase family protein [Deinococcus wulumuqiensis]